MDDSVSGDSVSGDSVSGVVGRLVDILEGSGVTYAFGGALALAAWSEPRATADVDVILWVDDSEIEDAIALMASASVELDPESAAREARARGMFVGRSGSVRVDVFVPSIPFYEDARPRRVRTLIAGRQTWVHSAEVLAVFKMLFFRAKDIVDVQRMVEVQGAQFDRAFVRSSLVQMLDEDERIVRWDGICEQADKATR